MERITAITPTGGRPEAFALCERWMQGQTRPPDEWIVVDDGETPTETTMGQKVIRPEVFWPHYTERNTQHRNLELALEMATGDIIVFVEDDDHYGPNHIANAETQLIGNGLRNDIVGEVPARYYHVGTRSFHEFTNYSHASLCQTAFRRSILPLVLGVIASRVWIDVTLWNRVLDARCYFWNLYRVENPEVIGIKGMPGREGVSRAHRLSGSGGEWQGDPGLDRLRQWIGPAASEYERFAYAAV